MTWCPCLLTLQVKLGLEEVATDLFRVKPYVYSSPNNAAVIVFSGEAGFKAINPSSLAGRCRLLQFGRHLVGMAATRTLLCFSIRLSLSSSCAIF